MHFKLNISNQTPLCPIYLAGFPLEVVSSYKYLGFIIDDRLNFKSMLSDTVSKLNNILYIFRKVCPALSLKASIAILKSKFISYIDYIWLFSYLLSKKDLKKLQVLQNSCIRCVYKLPRHANVDNHHCILKMLHVEN